MSYSAYTITLNTSADAYGEATQEDVAAMTKHLTTYSERTFPGVRVVTGLASAVTGPDDSVCAEIDRALELEAETHLANL